MRVTILTVGSRGEVQPFLPLGRALQARGHRVRVATFASFAPMVTEAGLGFFPLRGDPRAFAITQSDGLLDGRQNLVRMLPALQRTYFGLVGSLAQDLSDPALRDTELLLNQIPGGVCGCDLAEHLCIPHVMVGVIPLTFTRHLPMMEFPQTLKWLPGYSALTYHLAEQIGWRCCGPVLNRWRTRTLGLPAVGWRGPFATMRQQRVPVINGFSAHVVERPPDWGSHVHITGWWFPDDPLWAPPHALVRFLESGAPPVFIGFGSLVVKDPARLTALIVEAVQRTGLRAILLGGWAGLGQAELPPQVFPLAYAPYGWLFPRLAAVVHHGGSGTSGFGFRSGVPSLIVPFGYDQFYWGERAAALGVGPSPIPIQQVTAHRLACALHRAVTDPDLRRRAAELGEKIRAEDGTQRAVNLIEQMG